MQWLQISQASCRSAHADAVYVTWHDNAYRKTHSTVRSAWYKRNSPFSCFWLTFFTSIFLRFVFVERLLGGTCGTNIWHLGMLCSFFTITRRKPLGGFPKAPCRGEATVAFFYCITLGDMSTARTPRFCFLLHSARVNLGYCQKYISVKKKIKTK